MSNQQNNELQEYYCTFRKQDVQNIRGMDEISFIIKAKNTFMAIAGSINELEYIHQESPNDFQAIDIELLSLIKKKS